jgi:hypothetical protein
MWRSSGEAPGWRRAGISPRPGPPGAESGASPRPALTAVGLVLPGHPNRLSSPRRALRSLLIPTLHAPGAADRSLSRGRTRSRRPWRGTPTVARLEGTMAAAAAVRTIKARTVVVATGGTNVRTGPPARNFSRPTSCSYSPRILHPAAPLRAVLSSSADRVPVGGGASPVRQGVSRVRSVRDPAPLEGHDTTWGWSNRAL